MKPRRATVGEIGRSAASNPRRARFAGRAAGVPAAGALLQRGSGVYREFQRVQHDESPPEVIVTALELDTGELHTVGREAVVLRRNGQMEEELRAVVRRCGEHPASSRRQDARDGSHLREPGER